jgi:uncharacterized membrane protein
MQECKFCGSTLPNNAHFCANCGHVNDELNQRATEISSSTGLDMPTLKSNTPPLMNEPWHPSIFNASMEQSDMDLNTTLPWSGEVIIPDHQHFQERRTDENQAILPGMMLLTGQIAEGQAPAGNVPVVQGTPQVSGIPAVQGTPAMPAHPAGAQALYHNAPASAPNAPSAPSWVPHTSPPEAPPAHRRHHQTSGELHTHHHKPHRRHVPRPHSLAQHLLVAAVAVVVIATSAATGALAIFRPALSLSVNGGITPGGTFQLHGQNFTPGSSVSLTLDQGVPLSAIGHGDGGAASYGSGFANALQMSVAVEHAQQATAPGTSIPVSIQGTFDVAIHIGQNWSAGVHTIHATDRVLGRSAELQFTIPPSQAKLVVTPSSVLDFGSLQIGGKVALAVIVGNRGGLPLHWTADVGSTSWLKVQPASGTLLPGNHEQVVNIVANAGNLTAKNYSAVLHISSDAGDAHIAVKLRVIPPGSSSSVKAILDVNPASLDFGTQTVGVQVTMNVTLANSGTQALSWGADTGNANWLKLSSSSGNIQPGDLPQILSVTADTTQLAAGNHSATLNIKSNGGNKQVAITVVVTAATPTPTPTTTTPPTSPAVLTVNPASLDFGKMAPATSQALQETVGNSGGQALTWNLDTTSLPGWLSVDTSSGMAVSPGGQQTINVTADTTDLSPGSYTATLNFTSNGGNKVVPVTLIVNVPPPAVLGVSPNSLDFGALDPNTHKTLPETVSNTGGQVLIWQLDPTSLPSWLTVDKGSDTLQPGSQETINLTASTANLKAGGPYTATLNFTSNGGNVPVSVTLTVNSLPPILCLNPNPLDFGAVDPGGANKTLPEMICNKGGQPLNWKLDTTTTPLPFWLTLDTSSGTVQAGSSQTINLTVDTTDVSTGPQSATLNFTSTNGGGSASLSITLTVNPPLPPPGVSPLDFGVMDPGTTKTLPESITNSGGQALTWKIDPTSLPGWLTVDTSSGTVQPGSQQTINVTANTSNLKPGPYTATLNFTSNGGNAQAQVKLTVNNPPPPPAQIALGPPPDFGAVNQNTTTTLPQTVSNTGGQPLTWNIDPKSLPGWLTVDTSSGTVQPGSSETINVTVNTANLKPGPYSAPLNFTSDGSNGGNASVTISVTVNAPPPPPAQIAVSANSLDFGSVTTGNTAMLPETISNTGGQVLNWKLDPTSLPNWLTVDKGSDTLQPGSQETINLTASTANLKVGGPYTATLIFTSNGGNVQVTVTITVNSGYVS